MYHADSVVGNPEDGFDTISNWANRLNMRPSSFRRRLVKHGPASRKCFVAKRVFNRFVRVTDPTTGIKATVAEHARRIGISPATLSERIRNLGVKNPLTWSSSRLHSGGVCGINAPIWDRERHMKLRTNPLTGQQSYDYEWAELFNMTTGSFRDRLNQRGKFSRDAWVVNDDPRYFSRLDNQDSV